MKTSFAKQEEAETVPATTETLDESPSEATSLVSLKSCALAVGQVTGNLTNSDIQVPRLELVQSVGPLSEKFPQGAFILNKEQVLVEKEQILTVIATSIHKFYEEQLPYDPDGPRPRTFETLEEVHRASLWIDWRNDERPPCREVANVLYLIQKPEALMSPSFSTEWDGKRWALAMATYRGKAYTKAAKRIFSSCAIELARTGLLSGKWDLWSTREKAGKNLVYVPNLKLYPERTPREKLEELQSLLSA